MIYYKSDNIKKENANINIIMGERSNGKSYNIKDTVIFDKYFENKSRTMLLRRFREEISSNFIEQYFSDFDISKITNDKYNSIFLDRKTNILFGKTTDDFKKKKGEKLGYCASLSIEQNLAGSSFLDVNDIVFEEFISRSLYLSNEPEKLMNLYCTVDRKRGSTKLWLLGNTISKINPYITAWGLEHIFKTIKQGEIKTKEITIEDEGKPRTIKIAVEYCKSTGKSSFTIGNHSSMMNSGAWQTDPQPHLQNSLKLYKVVYRIGFHFDSYLFIGKYLYNPDTKVCCWFIEPYTKGSFDNNIIVFSNHVKENRNYFRNIYNFKSKSDKINNILNKFTEENIYYSDDNCGTDFKQVIDFSIRK